MNKIIKSPLNYMGGKAKLMPQISARLPKNIKVFYDVFCGGATVGMNVNAEHVVFVDNHEPLIRLLNFIKSNQYDDVVMALERLINHYGLSNSFLYGYDYYGCDSSAGLAQYNKTAFGRLREDFNQNTKDDLRFLLLIFFSFNNQIRFNRQGQFNLPVGKRDFNKNLRAKLKDFMTVLANKSVEFRHADFRQLAMPTLAQEQAFLYLDPPYLLGLASYNENGGWSTSDELALFDFLSECHQQGIRFALSNVMIHKGQSHDLLQEFCQTHELYVHELVMNYSNANYQLKDKNSQSMEVLITNYQLADER